MAYVGSMTRTVDKCVFLMPLLALHLASQMPCKCSHGVDVRHLWGMTEVSPLGTFGTLTAGQIGDGLTREEAITLKVRSRQEHKCMQSVISKLSKQAAWL